MPGEETETMIIIQRLEHALQRERSLGQSGQWSYDLNRHAALARALAAECANKKGATAR